MKSYAAALNGSVVPQDNSKTWRCNGKHRFEIRVVAVDPEVGTGGRDPDRISAVQMVHGPAQVLLSSFREIQAKKCNNVN